MCIFLVNYLKRIDKIFKTFIFLFFTFYQVLFVIIDITPHFP